MRTMSNFSKSIQRGKCRPAGQDEGTDRIDRISVGAGRSPIDRERGDGSDAGLWAMLDFSVWHEIHWLSPEMMVFADSDSR